MYEVLKKVLQEAAYEALGQEEQYKKRQHQNLGILT